MGAPRAEGPDPYARFEGKPAPPSNLRHFPTPDRALGENLKLSDMLGPSGGPSRQDEPAPADEDEDKDQASSPQSDDSE
jgi:hypothetical protein